MIFHDNTNSNDDLNMLVCLLSYFCSFSQKNYFTIILWKSVFLCLYENIFVVKFYPPPPKKTPPKQKIIEPKEI